MGNDPKLELLALKTTMPNQEKPKPVTEKPFEKLSVREKMDFLKAKAETIKEETVDKANDNGLHGWVDEYKIF